MAEAVRNALRPDDAEVPEGIQLMSMVVSSSLIYKLGVEFDDTSKLYTICNVVDDIVSHVLLALSVVGVSR